MPWREEAGDPSRKLYREREPAGAAQHREAMALKEANRPVGVRFLISMTMRPSGLSVRRQMDTGSSSPGKRSVTVTACRSTWALRYTVLPPSPSSLRATTHARTSPVKHEKAAHTTGERMCGTHGRAGRSAGGRNGGEPQPERLTALTISGKKTRDCSR